ncbi:MerR family transcriptional regulator [Agilicoccus flavus]|uniref:MerR family transcriptional regulator n=1 Tax=Agilicoccus flavus TaxID=2775968 RepID=UPI001CF632EA|nr:MerR family transcriptional regulator [Agilicoccus flavus]
MTETNGDQDAWTVGQVAERFGVTRRTLHHYDEIGLVVPGERSRSGYRLYTAADRTRLQHVVVYRRLEFGLDVIARLLDEPEDVAAHLRRQRAAVMSRVEELRGLLGAIDDALETTMTDQSMTPAQLKELFGDSFDESYQAEAQERWGDTDAWAQSQERQRRWTKADWQRIKDDTDALEADVADALDRGVPVDSDEAAALAERHLASIRVHYDCGHEMQRNIAAMYVDDPRFAAHYDARRPGLGVYLRDIIAANAARHGVA